MVRAEVTENGVTIERMAIRLQLRFDRRGVALQEQVGVPPADGTMYGDLVMRLADEAAEAMKRELQRYCPVSKGIRASGTRLQEVWMITRP